MSNFAKSHSLPTYEARKKSVKTKTRRRWLDADHIVDQCYCDLCNGVARSEIVLKLTQGLYDGQKKPMGERNAYDYLAAAMDRLHYDMEKDLENIRADLYGKLLTVYNDAMKEGDRYSAIGALGTMIKLVGAAKDKPQTAIQINSDKEGGVTVNFGFKSDENVSDSQ